MRVSVFVGLLLLGPVAAFGQDDDPKQLAQKILDKGAALFANKDAAAMAQTYTEDARVVALTKENDSPHYKVDIREGRPAIKEMYADLYKTLNEPIKPRNRVEYAKRIAPDLLVIHGTFELVEDQGDAYSFVQVRKQDGDTWRILSLQLFLIPKS